MRAVGGLQLYFPWWNFVRALEKVIDGVCDTYSSKDTTIVRPLFLVESLNVKQLLTSSKSR